MEIDYDFWITIVLGTIAGGVLGPLIIKWLRKKGFLKATENEN